MENSRPHYHKVEAAHIAGLIHGYLCENEAFLTSDQLQNLSIAQIIFEKESISETFLNPFE